MRNRILALAAAILILLTGCHMIPAPPATSTENTAAVSTNTTETVHTTPSTTAAAVTTEATEETTAAAVTAEATEETTAAPTETTEITEPAHSDLFIPYVSADDMVRYFNEVCLDAEFVNGGDATKLQRWEQPVCYSIHGAPTDADLQVLENLVQWLNTVEGFPGIFEADETWQTNMAIYFCEQQELIDRMGEQYWGTDGAFTFWYDGQDVIYDCTICIRTDLEQEVRNSVILEEIYNSLGPAQDTELRQESIIYSGYSTPQALHPIDQVILQLLYHPSLSCGMSAADCETIIRELYY